MPPLAWLLLVLLALPPLLLLLSQRLGPPQPPHLTCRPGMFKVSSERAACRGGAAARPADERRHRTLPSRAQHLLRLDLVSALELAVRERPVVRLGAWPLCMVVVSGADNLRQVRAPSRRRRCRSIRLHAAAGATAPSTGRMHVAASRQELGAPLAARRRCWPASTTGRPPSGRPPPGRCWTWTRSPT
jgi:hypothetical protein